MIDELYIRKDELIKIHNESLDIVRDIVKNSEYNRYRMDIDNTPADIYIHLDEMDKVDKNILACIYALKKKMLRRIQQETNAKSIEMDDYNIIKILL